MFVMQGTEGFGCNEGFRVRAQTPSSVLFTKRGSLQIRAEVSMMPSLHTC